MLSTLILLAYYERPVLVRNALRSILRANEVWPHWRLAFVDDSSRTPGEPIAREILAGHEDKITFYRLDTPAEEKMRLGGGLHGEAMNKAIKQSPCDLGVILCDDDELHPEYLKNLSMFFEKHERIMSCYSQVIAFNPLVETSETAKGLDYMPNRVAGLVNGAGIVDASQVAWRLSCCKEKDVWFASRRAKDHDLDFYGKLYFKTGPMFPSGFISQYKGIHPKQLGNLGPEAAWTKPHMVDKETNED